jgi:Flp pilus assembly protein TadG
MPAPRAEETVPMISPVSRYETFQNDTRGGVAMIFALSLTSLMMLIGCAVDYGRSIHARGKLAAAADIASLAAARDLRGGGKTDDEVRALARTYFDQNMAGSGNYATLTAFDVAINGAKNAVTIGLKAEMPTSFMRAGGITKINLPLTSTAVYDTKDIEVGLQLDVTGSMCSPCTKISDLKVATKDLLEILLPDGGTPNKVRIGLAPFAAGVNAGSYARDVAGGTAPGNCVYERASTSRAATDTSPSGMDRMLTKTDLPRAGDCPAGTSVVALTDNRTALRTAVDRLTTGGSTAGHLGRAGPGTSSRPTGAPCGRPRPVPRPTATSLPSKRPC